MFNLNKAKQKKSIADASANAAEADRLASQAYQIAKESYIKLNVEKEMKTDSNGKSQEESYKQKIQSAVFAIKKIQAVANMAQEALNKSDIAASKVELAEKYKAAALDLGFGEKYSERNKINKLDADIEGAASKAERARKMAEGVKEEARLMIERLEEEITENEEALRIKEEERIKKEMSDEELERKKKEALALRQKELLKTYTLTTHFRTNSYFLTKEFKNQIKTIALEISAYDYKKITIEGHTDNTGKQETNKKLSRQRARSVQDEFIKAGISPEKISSIGFADAIPVESNKTIKGRAANRRTEIFIE
jgi:outer membrane protein OmpA-like peptidoglycan-associated protein